MKKHLITIFLTLAVFIALLPFRSSDLFANDFFLQFSDPKDTRLAVDIKNVYVRTDDDFVYFRLESWENWNFEQSDCGLFIWFNTKGSYDKRDVNYALFVFEAEGHCIVGVFDGRNFIDLYEADFFRKNNPTIVVRLSKNTVRLSNDTFSFSMYLMSISDDYPLDIAPDSDIPFRFKPGPTTNNPKLSIEPKSLDFGTIEHDQVSERKLNIYNEGKADLKASIKSPSGAFTIFPDDLVVPGYGITEVSIRYNHAYAKTGVLTESIQIESNGGKTTITAKLDVLEKPVLVCTTDHINFGLNYLGDRPSDTIMLQNKNRGRIKGTIRSTQRWITLSTTTFAAEQQSVNITVNTRGLDPGEYEGKILIQSDGGEHTIHLGFEVQSAFDIKLDELDFGSYDLDQIEGFPEKEILVSNISPRNQQLSITVEKDWLKLSETSLNLNQNGSKSIRVSVDYQKLEKSSQDYTNLITIQNRNESFTIPAKLSIQFIPPKLQWMREDEKTERIFRQIMIGSQHNELIEITNSGGGELIGSASLKHKNTPHRLFNPFFKLKKDETHSFRISFNAAKQDLREYREVLIIQTNGGNLEIPIIFEVIPLPEIEIKLFIGIAYAYIDNKEIKLDEAPYISKGSSMVPLRFIGEAFKAQVEWQNIGKGRIIISLKEKRLQLDIGEILAFIDGLPYVLNVAPEIKNNRTFVPIRFISEGLGATIAWDASKNMITIRFPVDPD